MRISRIISIGRVGVGVRVDGVVEVPAVDEGEDECEVAGGEGAEDADDEDPRSNTGLDALNSLNDSSRTRVVSSEFLVKAVFNSVVHSCHLLIVVLSSSGSSSSSSSCSF